MDDFSGKTAVITGAASGIGFAMAERFASEGMRVVLADIEQAALDAAVARIYHMTKHAVLALSEALFHELALSSEKVSVSVLCPELIKTGIATCERNRPSEYSKPGDVLETDARQLVMDAISDGVESGVEPSVMADRVVRAIRSGTFYILSEDGWRETANQRMEDIRAGSNPVLAPPV